MLFFLVCFVIGIKGNAVGLGQNRVFILLIRRFLRDLSVNLLNCTIFEAKQKRKKTQKIPLVCLDIEMNINLIFGTFSWIFCLNGRVIAKNQLKEYYNCWKAYTFWRPYLLDIAIRHGPYHRTHHFIANLVESKPDNTGLSHRYCADIGDGISTIYLVTTMIIFHFNHLLWEVNRGNCRLQRAVYPCLFISNTQL